LNKNTYFITAFLLLCICLCNSQEVIISGKVTADDDVEGIHIINKTANKFTITNLKGEFFISAKVNDTILISGIKYVHEQIIVDNLIYETKHLIVYLKENVNQLNEVVIGRFLTGDLRSDVLNTKIKKEINFYDVGIPGYTGKPLTQKERRLFEADHGKMLTVFQNGLLNINIHKILNRISGRTKKLKNHVRLEALDTCLNKTKSEFSEIIFGDFDIEENLKTDFFFFASEDPEFIQLCKSNNSIAMFEFLVDKLVNYNENLEEGED